MNEDRQPNPGGPAPAGSVESHALQIATASDVNGAGMVGWPDPGTWFYYPAEVELGPVTAATLRSKIESGEVPPDAPVRSTSMSAPAPASSFWSFSPVPEGLRIGAVPPLPSTGSFSGVGSAYQRLQLRCPRCRTEHALDPGTLDGTAERDVASAAPTVEVRLSDVTLGKKMGSLVTFALLGAVFAAMRSGTLSFGIVVGGLILGLLIGLVFNGIAWMLSTRRKLIVLECHPCGQKIFLGRRGDQVDVYAV